MLPQVKADFLQVLDVIKRILTALKERLVPSRPAPVPIPVRLDGR